MTQRNIRLTGLQARQIVGQHHQRACQGRQIIVGRQRVVGQHGLGQRLGLLGEPGRTVQLDHEQRAHDLMQVGDAESQTRVVGRGFEERLKRQTRLLERLVDFVPDPTEGGQVNLALRAHRSIGGLSTGSPPPSRGRDGVGVLVRLIRSHSPFQPSVEGGVLRADIVRQAVGNLKPATDACSSRARSDSLPIESAVWRVPVEVMVVAS